MNLTIEKIPDSKYKLIPVASELVPEGIKTITYKEEVFQIVDKYTFHKKEFFPTGLMNFVFGQEINQAQIWDKYKDSDRLIVFICKPIEKVEKINKEKKGVQNQETQIPTLF